MPAETTARIPTPNGMVRVTRDEFFAALYADKRDIMPTQENESFSDWLVVSGKQPWGRTFPGWKNPGDTKGYFLVK